MDQTSSMGQKAKLTPKDFFLNLGAIISLYIASISFVSFLFDVINTLFPDKQDYYIDPYSTGLRIAVSTLIVFFPLLLILSRFIYKDLLAHPEKRELGFRKWLIYFTLFITSLTLAINVIILLNTFLGGEITTRFILKTLTVFAVAGVIFWYYLADLRGRFYQSPRTLHIFAWIIIAIVILKIIFGFVFIGSPIKQRALRFDAERISDLNSIQMQVVYYYQRMGALPPSMEQLQDPISNYSVPVDPKTNEPYEYSIISSSTTATGKPQFSICATFEQKTDPKQQRMLPYNEMTVGGGISDTWNHDAGRTCFTRTVDPARYPVNTTSTSIPPIKSIQ